MCGQFLRADCRVQGLGLPKIRGTFWGVPIIRQLQQKSCVSSASLVGLHVNLKIARAVIWGAWGHRITKN